MDGHVYSDNSSGKIEVQFFPKKWFESDIIDTDYKTYAIMY